MDSPEGPRFMRGINTRGRSSSSSCSSTSDGLFDGPEDMQHGFVYEKSWDPYPPATTRSARIVPARYLLLARRISRVNKIIIAVSTALFLFFIFHWPRRLTLGITGSSYSSSCRNDRDYDNGIAASGLAGRGHHIPPKIWQVMFTPRQEETGGYDFDANKIPYTSTWLAKNPDYQYTLIGTEGANRFVRQHFSHDQRVLDVHFGLRNHGPRSDLMRYLIMLVEGGVYSDTDVTCLRPVDTWVPERWRNDVRAVVGVEGDSLGGPVIPGMVWDVQFGQWTVAAVRGHRLFKCMLNQMLDRLEELCVAKNTTIDQLELTPLEIMNATAPAGWSECVFRELQKTDPSLKAPKDLSGMKEARLYGDIMVLSINGFGMGVRHSGSMWNGTVPPESLVRHHFHSSWRNQDGIEKPKPIETKPTVDADKLIAAAEKSKAG